MKKRDAELLLKRMEAAKRKIAEGRDDLRKAIGDSADILESVERAESSLEEAADALSEYL
jgi:ABC-type transporter Mla subunit MlaD